ncbi:hypothetical protein HTZ84_21075 [Haloterrigena sp. SYSU A558-1]|uniref:Uncharacterized protein n=1 Tax=Haloterrigena gelatinilytica TaxID=2741724 RepID=A0ABX2LHB2_9EURY|nr:hypothetical protein [Haloterrigena gelatinilytica]NUC74758.1 hypothetical protein [Haloterrigena gelatinilytica]
MDERPNLAEEATTLLTELQQDFSPLQITMLLAAAQQIHTAHNAHSASIERIIRGDHLTDNSLDQDR